MWPVEVRGQVAKLPQHNGIICHVAFPCNSGPWIILTFAVLQKSTMPCCGHMCCCGLLSAPLPLPPAAGRHTAMHHPPLQGPSRDRASGYAAASRCWDCELRHISLPCRVAGAAPAASCQWQCWTAASRHTECGGPCRLRQRRLRGWDGPSWPGGWPGEPACGAPGIDGSQAASSDGC